MKKLKEKHQEKMAKKNAIIRELEEENKFLASEVANLAKENKSLKKKLRESQGTMKEDEECKKLTEEIQRFHKEIGELKIISILQGSKKLEQPQFCWNL
ncbi:rho-associated protein kinase 2-like [Notechis scutatus]|uniref:Rho-associated protein kinase 2-like n=1 Tax=Notechis scutatus TaxID=8663 RepID=A0A6J1UIH3_9SAUR|nr:rho-associated protein kinase 2-like [Notechis scutatus]XP_026530136.1 rho-associated protein kinase 2-like [Notechis scutatus]